MEEKLGKYIDHTLLKPNAKIDDFVEAARIAKEYECASLCIPATFLADAAPVLQDSQILLCTVVGFPFGYSDTNSKLAEVNYALSLGALEIDMVINIAQFVSGKYMEVAQEIETLANQCHLQSAKLKVIIETAYLDDAQKVKACQLAYGAGADFVKTSTGYAPSGATVEDIRLMHETVGGKMGIKASGGIQDKQSMLALIDAGATRIGTSRTKAILTGETASSSSAY